MNTPWLTKTYKKLLQETIQCFQTHGRPTKIISTELEEGDDIETLFREIPQEYEQALIVTYNTLWRPIVELGRKLGVTSGVHGQNYLSKADLTNFAELAGWEVFWSTGRTLIPLPFWWATLINRWVAPVVPWICLNTVLVARRKRAREAKLISIVVPARNEAGNIPTTTKRIPDLGRPTEIVFVEGNSKDNTWEVIQALPKTDELGRTIKIMQQPGKGKGDAVRKGFDNCEGDLLLILDADLTMPPEDLPRYIRAIESGACDFANGSRLVYNMDKKAMRFCNLVANKCFSIAFTWLLGQPLKDTLCGTKVIWREDYDRVIANRAHFGDFDPFGDFDLLFGAAYLNLRIRDIPIRYRDREYGETNISRWTHGCILLGMMLVAAKKLKFRK